MRPLVRQSYRQPSTLYRTRLRPSQNALSARALRLPRLQIRRASTAAAGTSRILNVLFGGTLLLGLGIVYVYVTDTRASIHRWVVVPSLRGIYQDPERAHEVGNASLKALWTVGLHPRERGDPDAKGDLEVEVFGTTLRNPIGTSAGIDKHAEIPDPLMAMGPAIIEIGGTTPQPQPGNEKPRVFRLSSQNALINRYGLNSEGADSVAARLRQRVREFAHARGFGVDDKAEKAVLNGDAGVPPGSLTLGKLLAINIAKNKSTPENDVQAVADDYVYCVQRLAPYADILVVNVSSPNTPGLRSLQQSTTLKQILSAVVSAAQSTDRKVKPAVMVKVSPDEDSDEQVAGIVQAVWDSGVDGVIVGNTTNRRPPSLPHLKSLSVVEEQHLLEQGGFSGPHLYQRTLALVKKYKGLLEHRPQSDVPSRKPGALAGEAKKLKASLDTKQQDQNSDSAANDTVTNSVESLVVPAKNLSDKPDSEKQPLINLPSDRKYDQANPNVSALPVPNTTKETTKNTTAERQTSAEVKPATATPAADSPKVIFATGGITNGKQALDVLNAGASVAMVYTALVYGGAGTISRIKDEMRQELSASKGTSQTTTK